MPSANRTSKAPVLFAVRQALKRRLSDEQVRRISHWRSRVTWAEASARIIEALGPRRAIQVKERIKATGRLDYPRAAIFLTLDSSTSFIRLGGCAKEPDTVAWIERCIRAGDVFYDIGANVGAYSFVAHAVTGGKCRVFAFEPSFATFAALSENIRLNQCGDSIVALPVALSDETRLTSFNYASLASGASMHSLGDEALPHRTTPPEFRQQVMSYRMEDLVRAFGVPPPNHLKIDVDGPELKVLQGAGDLLGSPSVRSLLVEVDELRYTNGEIRSLIEAHGFRLVERYPRITEGSFNYIFER